MTLFTSAGLMTGGTPSPDLVAIPAAVSWDREISGVFCRSQDVVADGLFVAIQGYRADGHDFIPEAIAKGAVAVVSQRPVAADTMIFQVADTRKALADLAAAHYGHPSRRMVLIAITGTNGKTTTSYLIENILSNTGASVGVIGTINYRYAGRSFDNPVTTPESLDLQSILAAMYQAGVSHVVMEVSSHALDLHRLHGCALDIAVFTNLSQDHLDFHGDMATYWQSKKKLFTDILPASPALSPDGAKVPRSVINGEDPRGRELIDTLPLPVISTGRSPAMDIWVQDPIVTLSGIEATIHTPRGELAVRSPLIGTHNLENILNAVGVGLSLDIPLPAIQSGIARLDHVPGRLEKVPNDHHRFVYVDYAHTPDALENVLSALRQLTSQRLICIFGCGGDRDKGKRPLMGDIATRISDVAVVTSDNPRSERPQDIIDDILAGIRPRFEAPLTRSAFESGNIPKGYLVVSDRRKAIEWVIASSRSGDTILISGKGHENYQIIGRTKYPFDDREEALKALGQLAR